jgi:mono/diheme cytochrome c family protein
VETIVSRNYLYFGAVLIAILLLSACNTHTERPPDTEYLMAEGHQIYVEFCAECHQIDGQGWSDLFPRLAGNPVVTLHDPEPVIDTVLYGQGSMMSFKDKINSEQIAAVLTYIRNSWGNKAAAVSPRQVH